MENQGSILKNRREFKDPVSGNSYFIAAPTADNVRSADWQYSKVYTKSLIEGITTAAEMMDILMRRGITGPEFEQRQKELTDELAIRVEYLQKSKDVDEKQKFAMEVASAREELFSWNQRLNGPMSNTCEQIADDTRLEFLTSCMVQDKDCKRVWEDYSDFLKEKNQALATRSRFEVMLYLQGLDSDFLEKTPEAQAIKEVELEIQDKAKKAMDDLEKIAADKEKSSSKSEDTSEKPKSTRSTRKKKSVE